MASPNMNMRDPILYRIRKVPHHQTGDRWVIYPTYDFAHGQEDAIEGITHSICTLEFEDHRPLYDWFIEHLPVPARPRQYEFGRLNPSYTITSKRKLKQLVDDGVVAGWDDPRMPTIAGMRRRGYTPAAIRKFCQMIGTTRSDGVVDVAMLEFAIREDLNENAPRAMCVLNPLKVVLTDYPEGQVEELVAPRHPIATGTGRACAAIHPGAVYRRRRLSRGSEQEIQAPGAGQAGAAAQRLRDRGRRGGEGRRRQGGGGPRPHHRRYPWQ